MPGSDPAGNSIHANIVISISNYNTYTYFSTLNLKPVQNVFSRKILQNIFFHHLSPHR